MESAVRVVPVKLGAASASPASGAAWGSRTGRLTGGIRYEGARLGAGFLHLPNSATPHMRSNVLPNGAQYGVASATPQHRQIDAQAASAHQVRSYAPASAILHFPEAAEREGISASPVTAAGAAINKDITARDSGRLLLRADKSRRENSAALRVFGSLERLSAAKNPEPLWVNGAGRSAAGVGAVAGRTAARGADVLHSPGAARLEGGLAARGGGLSDETLESEPGDPAVIVPTENLWTRFRDHLQYRAITLSSLYWYTFPRLIERWEELREAAAAARGEKRAVKNIMGFFVAHRVLGSTGSYAPMGFRIAVNRAVIRDSMLILNSYFSPDSGTRKAFKRFIVRAKRYNPNRGSTQFRKLIFHALRSAAVMNRDEVRGYFNSLITPAAADMLSAYQRDQQPEILRTFERLVEETILEVNRGAPRGRRVVSALLLGSFASGSAGPGSDLDLQTVTEDGGAAASPEFYERLEWKWREAGMDFHPISTFQYALPISKRLITKVHRDAYRIISPYAGVTAALQRTPEEESAVGRVKKRTFRGFVFMAFYSAVLFGVLAGYGAIKRLRRLF